MSAKWLLLLIVASLVPPAAGCRGPEEIEPAPVEETAEPAPQGFYPSSLWRGSSFIDVPVPPEFSLLFEKSYTYDVEDSVRISQLNYEGKSDIEAVLRFFQQRMPQNGWSFTQLSGVKVKMLRYAKGAEECMIAVRKSDGTIGITVKIHPR